MKTTSKLVLLSLVAFAAAPLACSSDSTTSGTLTDSGTGGAGIGGSNGSTGGKGTGGAAAGGKGGASGASTGGKSGGGASAGGASAGGSNGDGGADAGGPPPPPAIGATQIDRMGRPGVNTALTDPFDIVPGKTPDQVKDLYNAASNPAGWATAFTPYIETNLAILDSLDGTCGNQFAVGAATDGGAKNRYSALAGILVDDELYLNTAATTCTQYLAVEASETTDCGGRGLGYDVIDVTYSALAVGALSGVTDGVPSDTTGTQTTTFPFLAPPQ